MGKNKSGIRKLIALFAIIFLGEAYTSGFGGKIIDEYENVTYKFESVYPDIETMNSVERKQKESNAKNDGQCQTA